MKAIKIIPETLLKIDSKTTTQFYFSSWSVGIEKGSGRELLRNCFLASFILKRHLPKKFLQDLNLKKLNGISLWALNWNIKTSLLKILPTTTLWASHVHANNIKNTPLHITPSSTWSLDLASPFLPCCTTIFSTWSLSSGYLSICNSKRVLITITKTLLDDVFVTSRIISRAEGRSWWRLPRPWLFRILQKKNVNCLFTHEAHRSSYELV